MTTTPDTFPGIHPRPSIDPVELREHMLDFATRIAGIHTPVAEVITTARAFEHYALGDTTTTTKHG